MRRTIPLFFFILSLHAVSAQQIIRTPADKLPIICYAEHVDKITARREAPESFLRARSSGARIKSSTIEVEYFGFTPEAQASFAEAVAIWESLITSPVPIRVAAVWSNLPAGVLGAAGPGYWISNFKGAPNLNVYYPGALAEKLAGSEQGSPEDYEIIAQFNSSADWYFPATGFPAAGQHDFITVVLHELGHGLGFTSTYEMQGSFGSLGSFTEGIPFPFDLAIETGVGQNLFQAFNSPSGGLGTALTSEDLFFVDGILALDARLYAPDTFDDGSSISHLDAGTYPQGTPNALMRPFVNSQEVNHDPGPIVNSIFAQMGWVTTYINHDHLEDREDVTQPIEIRAVVRSDGTPGYTFAPESVTVSFVFNSGKPTRAKMLPSGNPDEYVFTIPGPNQAAVLYYSIDVKDNLNRMLRSPGFQYFPDSFVPDRGPVEARYMVAIGPDLTGPEIVHTPKAYLSYQDEELTIEVEIKESSGLASVALEYQLNNEPQTLTAFDFVSEKQDFFEGFTVYTYRKVVPFTAGSLVDGDVFHYRITATDQALAANAATTPTTGMYSVPVKGLVPAQPYYVNSFDTPTDDFIGENFSITTPAGFDNPAIHSDHPYEEAGEGNQLNFTYQLRIPILVNEIGTLSFDEIVIVEPGEDGATFGSEDFYDYVVVEVQKVGDTDWEPLAAGYDARDYQPWLSKYQAEQNGDKSLFRRRTLSLLSRFEPADEISIRFRLYSDPFASGWGWAIDNLRIQTDEGLPLIQHNHVDFLKEGETTLNIPVNVSDDLMLKQITLTYQVNEGSSDEELVELSGTNAIVDFSLDPTGLTDGDVIHYSYTLLDSADNVTHLPATGAFDVAVLSFEEEVDSYTTDFNTANDDFAGNFFQQSRPSGFTNDLITIGPSYPSGFGYEDRSDFTYTFKKKVVVDAENPTLQFDEIAIVEPHASGVAFGTEAFKDYVIVEASKDGGSTWIQLLDGYDATTNGQWQQAYNNGASGLPGYFVERTINLLDNGEIQNGDKIVIRFRLYSDAATTGWGWAIDNLNIQHLVTGAEQLPDASLRLFPNPAVSKTTTLHWQGWRPTSVQVTNVLGQPVRQYDSVSLQDESVVISLEDQPEGVFLIRASDGRSQVIRKLVVGK